MTPFTVRAGKSFREASEGLVALKVPIACGCGHNSTEILLDKTPHLTAFCGNCRRYPQHVKAADLKGAPTPPSTESTRLREELSFPAGFGIILCRAQNAFRVQVDEVVGTFATMREKRAIISDHRIGTYFRVSCPADLRGMA